MTLDNCQLVTILNEGDLRVVSYQWPWLGPHALQHPAPKAAHRAIQAFQGANPRILQKCMLF